MMSEVPNFIAGICHVQAQIREWYLQAFAQIQAGTTGAIALADEADGEDATPDKGADASSDQQRMQQKVGQDFQITPAFMHHSGNNAQFSITLISSPRHVFTCS